MANEIFKGNDPYYGVIDSKNPLVEYFWAFIHFLIPSDSIVFSARIAESFWIGITIILLFKFLKTIYPEYEKKLFTFPILLTAQFLLSFWKVTDNGFNVSIYQGLFEFLSIYFGFKILASKENLSSPKLLFYGISLGLYIFLAWMVKQTSLISIFIPLTFFAILFCLSPEFSNKKQKFFSILLGVFICLSLLSLFFLQLYSNNTLTNYWAGTYTYNLALSKNGINGQVSTTLLQKMTEYISNPKSLVGGLLILVFICFASLISINFIKPIKNKFFTFGICLWIIAVVIQSLGKFTFFNHYFLALIIPTFVLLSIVLYEISPTIKKQWTTLFLTLGIGIHLNSQMLNQRKILTRMSKNSAQLSRVKILRDYIPMNSKVFNWSGVMHFFVETNISSYYEMNQIWNYIISYHWKDKSELNHYMIEKFKNNAPDFFLEQWEEYPKDQSLKEFRLDQEILKTWTGKDYQIILKIPSGSKRYELETILYKKN